MKFKKTEVGGTVEILAADDFDAIPVTVAVNEGEDTLVLAGTPLGEGGKPIKVDTGGTIDLTGAKGILLYDVDTAENPNGALLIRAILDGKKIKEHAGIDYNKMKNGADVMTQIQIRLGIGVTEDTASAGTSSGGGASNPKASQQ